MAPASPALEAAWQRIHASRRFGILPGLERMRELVRRLDHPERSFRVIHIAGTNGKGSLARLLGECITASGRGCAVYTSPHLFSPLERIALDGASLSEEAFLAAWRELEPALAGVDASYFEQLTALAFLAIRRAGAPWAVIECGLGGRWDATNVVDGELGVITSVSLDHTRWLGDSLARVATDKAGIARAGRPLLLGPCPREAADAAAAVALDAKADLHRLSHEDIAMLPGGTCIPDRLVDRISWALASRGLSLLPGLSELRPPRPWCNTLPGRRQWLRKDPPLLVDVAHNPAGLRALAQELGECHPGQRFRVVFAAMEDKDHRDMLRALHPLCERLLLADIRHPRLAEPEDLLRFWRELGGQDAAVLNGGELERLRDTPGDSPLLVVGGFVLAAWWLGAEELPPGL